MLPPSASTTPMESEEHVSGSSSPRAGAIRPPISFRRMSMPSVPCVPARSEVTSISSLNDVIPEDQPLPDFMRPSMGPRMFSEQGSASSGMTGGPNAPLRSPKKFVRERRNSRQRGLSIDEGAAERAKKRFRVVQELWETERTYKDGLDLIYEHFLTPLIASIERPTNPPLITRDDLTAIFSNFIDIWNLHRSILASLSELMTPSTTSLPTLSSILMSHFPYLSLYKPFITNFPSSLSTISHLQSTSPAFASWLAVKERDAKCQSLSLISWLLTCVQRVPRYLLLIKDLITLTDVTDEEGDELRRLFTMLSKTADTLNASLSTHSLTLSALGLQRSCPDLPFPLIAPGRRLLKRGSLLKEGPKGKEHREFLLFSDCLLYFSRHSDDAWLMERRRSRSDNAQVRRIGDEGMVDSDRWKFHAKIELQDVDVIGGGQGSDEDDGGTRFEILSPQESFAVYAANASDCSSWLDAIREAKALLLSSLQTLGRPLSTLTSSTATRSLRLALQALPAESERRKVDHFVPAVWVPDRKAPNCMRCGGAWSIMRWRHHCRLCGLVVCAACSTKTFYISNLASKSKEERQKPARACDTCYETIFPVVEPQVAELPPVHQPSRLDNSHPPELPTYRFSMPNLAFPPTTSRPTTPSADPASPSSPRNSVAPDLDNALPELTTTLLELGVSPFAGALRRTEVQRMEVLARLRVADAATAEKKGGKAARRLSFVLSKADKQRAEN